MAGFAYHTSFRNVGYTDLPEDDDLLSNCSGPGGGGGPSSAPTTARSSPQRGRGISTSGAADAAAAREAVGDISLMAYISPSAATQRAGGNTSSQRVTSRSPNQPQHLPQRPSPRDRALLDDEATDDSRGDSRPGSADHADGGELDHMRAVLGQRVAHHAQRFHKDLKLTSDAVGLLDLLVGGIRLPSASESSYGVGGAADVTDEQKHQQKYAAEHEGDTGGSAQLKAQLRQTNAVSDGMQLAMDVLRARAQLEQEARAKAPATSKVFAADDDKKQGLFHPWDRTAHRSADATIAFACEGLSDAGLARAQREAAATLALIHEAPVGDLSRAIRETNARVVASRAKEDRLRADIGMLRRALAAAEADAEGLGSLQATADPRLFYLPQDAREWGPWAAEIASFGSSPTRAAAAAAARPGASAASSGATALPATSPPARADGGGEGTSLFLEDRVSVIDVAAKLPEMKLWADVCNDAFARTLQRLAEISDAAPV